MNETLDRVAKAICDVQHGHGAYDAHAHLRSHFATVARAGLEELRKFNTEDFSLTEAGGIRRLIDEALEPC